MNVYRIRIGQRAQKPPRWLIDATVEAATLGVAVNKACRQIPGFPGRFFPLDFYAELDLLARDCTLKQYETRPRTTRG